MTGYKKNSADASFSWPLLTCTGELAAGALSGVGGGRSAPASQITHNHTLCLLSQNAVYSLSSWSIQSFLLFCHNGKYMILHIVMGMILLGERIADWDLVTIKWDWEGARCQKRGCKGVSSA